MYAQVIDDHAGRTLAAASTVDKDLRGDVKYGGNKAAAQAVGKAIAERALAAGIKKVAFDRGGMPVSRSRGGLGRLPPARPDLSFKHPSRLTRSIRSDPLATTSHCTARPSTAR